MSTEKPRVTAYITDEQRKALRILAARNDMSMSEYLSYLIQRAIENNYNLEIKEKKE